MDTGFIPFTGSDEDNFIEVIDGNFSIFSPDIINSVEDDGQYNIVEDDTWSSIPMDHLANPTKAGEPEAKEEQPYLPHVWYLRNIINDESHSKYSAYSDINTCHTASLGSSKSTEIPYEYFPPPPLPEPPPNTPVIHVTEVQPHEYDHDESMPIFYTRW